MSLYGWVLILSLAGPIVFSFHKKIRFVEKWGKVVGASLIVALPFWVWDAVATRRGDWSFNPKYVGPTKIGGLPIEEILFFVVIPFCCLFIWEIIDRYIKDKKIICNRWAEVGLTGLMVLGMVAFREKYYTATLLAWALLTITTLRFGDKQLLRSANYWRWILITFVPFLVVNGVLTALPVVSYSPEAIIGTRIGTIPSEDFLYSWSLLTLNLVVYRKLKLLNNL